MNYIQLRNSCIDDAMHAAKQQVLALGREFETRVNGRLGEYTHYFETEFFHKEMNRRSKEALRAKEAQA